jgi:hypothetical protein
MALAIMNLRPDAGEGDNLYPLLPFGDQMIARYLDLGAGE